MPLAFSSKSHGRVAFGFFNIETDMLLLENLFFFADNFCHAVAALAEDRDVISPEFLIDGFRITDSVMIGNLHGAIQGIDLRGFIGETYRMFPFPGSHEAFKQKPYGHRNRPIIRKIIQKFGKSQTVRFTWKRPMSSVSVEEYIFDQEEFRELVAYVVRGGYPRWQEELRPPYVPAMMKSLKEISSPLLPHTE
jgi:hypothetical protein